MPADARARDDHGPGAEIHAPGGRLLAEGDVLRQPGLVAALEALAEEGPSAAYTGSLGGALLELMRERGGAVTEADLASYRPTWSEPVALDHAGARVLTRAGLSGVPSTFRAVGRLRGLSPAERVVRLAEAFAAHLHEAQPHTTNLVTVDADGNAVVLTTSLGLGSGDFVPGLDLHLNSMLGEMDLIVGDLEPGDRVHSMMAPTLAVDDDGPMLAIGSAGGTRLRTALVSVAAGVLDEGSGAPGGGRPAAPAPERRHGQRRARRGRGRPRRARAPRVVGAPLVRAAPLLRRRLARRARRPGRRPAPQRRRGAPRPALTAQGLPADGRRSRVHTESVERSNLRERHSDGRPRLPCRDAGMGALSGNASRPPLRRCR